MRSLIALPFAAAALAADSADFFETKVRPVFAAQCLECHGKAEMGGLRLDSRARALKGGKSGAAVAPGKPDSSLLIQAVSHTHATLKMPPKGKLGDEQIADLRQWIESGAVWPEGGGAKAEAKGFWSFQPVRKPALPQPRSRNWAKTGADRFVLERLEKEGMRPAPETSRRNWIRRVTFDLTGLPPTPAETAAFLADSSSRARENVVERLLSSPHYGERQARLWLDLARYADGQQGARDDTPYANAYRYRDWVVDAFNKDLPYDSFVKAQIAADHAPAGERERLLPGLGFQTIGESDDDRLDVTTRVFLGFTVGCARCHDHKYDPIPTRDYYSLLGVFKSSKAGEHPLAPAADVEAYKKAKTRHQERQDELNRFLKAQTGLIADILAAQTRRYVMAAWRTLADPAVKAADAAAKENLDREVLERWAKYLSREPDDHKHMSAWHAAARKAGGPGKIAEAELERLASTIHDDVQKVFAEKKAVDDRNYVKVGGIEGMKNAAAVIKTLVDALPVDKYYFWRDLASGPYKIEDLSFPGGVYYVASKDVERFFSPQWKEYLASLRAEVKALEKAIPTPYPFWHVLEDQAKPRDLKVALRGNTATPGEVAPRRFLSALCDGEPQPFTKGSGRAEFAEAIVANPLAARVMANRVWKQHFGEGLVRSTSNFGRNGDRPTHPELLDHLAALLVESGWSVKALHREMVLSAAYAMASAELPIEYARKDPENKLLWRANVRERLDAEALRDSILSVAGALDPTVGGPSKPLDDELTRRTLYATVSRSKPDRMLALFDFPDPNATSEQRMVTVGPMQRLFFMNSAFIAGHSRKLAERMAKDAGENAQARIARAYDLLFSRPATAEETRLGVEFTAGKPDSWPRYAQVLLGAAEFSSIQ